MRQPSKFKNNTSKRKKTESAPVKRNNYKKQGAKYGISKLETYFATEFLDKANITYVYQYEVKEIGRFYDFAIISLPRNEEVVFENKNGVTSVNPLKNNFRLLCLVEIDGGFW